MKNLIKIYLVAFFTICTTISKAETNTNGFSICDNIEIVGPTTLAPNTTQTYTITGGPIGYNYSWSSSNTSLLTVNSFNSTTGQVSVTYISGKVELTLFVFKDDSSESCCLSISIKEPIPPPTPKYCIVATSCGSTSFSPECSSDGGNWTFKLVNILTGVEATGRMTWPEPTGILGNSPYIDNQTSTSGASMSGYNNSGIGNDCYGFTVVCLYGGKYYYGDFRAPGSGSETCNSSHASASGIIHYGVRIQTGTRQDMIDSGLIN